MDLLRWLTLIAGAWLCLPSTACTVASAREARDPVARRKAEGRSLFDRDFTRLPGFSAKGDDAGSCAACHSLGGPGGAGSARAFALPHEPPQVLGVGYVAALASEMSTDLQAQRSALQALARRTGAAHTVALASKGVAFGTLTAFPDGRLEVSSLTGVDADLIVKPFGWQGREASLGGFSRAALREHFDIAPAEQQRRADTSAESLAALATFLALQPAPAARAHGGPGEARFEALCAGCHRPALPLEGAALGSTDFAPLAAVSLPPLPSSSGVVPLYSDLRRHDMGPGLTTRHAAPWLRSSVFLTRPLWGVADTPPYMHDGRAPTLDAAIRAHDGEAAPARLGYLNLTEDEREELLSFLSSLRRGPDAATGNPTQFALDALRACVLAALVVVTLLGVLAYRPRNSHRTHEDKR